ncbi:MAG TPA: VTT domain-containing protein [Burkholderiaceae bacterium]|jgi:membrane-associated protein|nr:VTT domain-containing protein [Burkholderiaceae bacterium]
MGNLIEPLLHADRYLAPFVAAHGPWVYSLLFAIIFIETGLVVMPFLPGDSLLFIVGAGGATGLLDLPVALLVMLAAAVAGNQANYTIGRWAGPRVFRWEQSRWFNREGFDRTHAFYEKYGGATLVLGRFMPFVRTFAPFVAGVAHMTRSRFTLFDVTGGVLWVGSITLAGYLFGNLPWVRAHIELIVLATIMIPGIGVLVGALRGRRNRASEKLVPEKQGSDKQMSEKQADT